MSGMRKDVDQAARRVLGHLYEASWELRDLEELWELEGSDKVARAVEDVVKMVLEAGWVQGDWLP